MSTKDQIIAALNRTSKDGSMWHDQYNLSLVSNLVQSTVSKHLKILVEAGLVVVEDREWGKGKKAKHYCLVQNQDQDSIQVHTDKQNLLTALHSLISMVQKDDYNADAVAQCHELINQATYAYQKPEILNNPNRQLISTCRNAFAALTDEETNQGISEVLGAPKNKREGVFLKWDTLNKERVLEGK